jgi:hypothetical protein
MQPNYIPQEPAFELDWSDRKAVQKLYGKEGLGRSSPELPEDVWWQSPAGPPHYSHTVVHLCPLAIVQFS